MKICVVGNSHIAALKHAVQNGALDDTGADVVFFGAPGKNFKKIRFSDGVIRGPETLRDMFLLVSEGRHTEIDPAEFDAVVVYGGFFNFHRLLGNIHHALSNHVHLSEDCLAKGIERWLTSKHAFQLIEKIGKANSTTRAILVPRPIPAVGAADSSDTVDPNSKNLWLWEKIDTSFRKKIWDNCSQTAERRGVEVFLQPESTIDANQYTRPEYTARSTRLLKPDVNHGEADVSHMNARFGEVVLQGLLDYLAQPTNTHP